MWNKLSSWDLLNGPYLDGHSQLAWMTGTVPPAPAVSGRQLARMALLLLTAVTIVTLRRRWS